MKTLTLDIAELRVESWQTDASLLEDVIPTTTVHSAYRTCTC